MDLSQYKSFQEFRDKNGLTTLEANLILLDELKKRSGGGGCRG